MVYVVLDPRVRAWPESLNAMLQVRDLKVSFRTEHGLVRAVDDVSFDVDEGEILGVVGESGSGKTVSLLSVIGLIIDPNAVIEGSIVYKGRELIGLPQRELRHVRGNEIAMIFQDPMTALTPVYTIGWQIAEQVLTHNDMSKRAARAARRRSSGRGRHAQSRRRRRSLSAPAFRRHAPAGRDRHGAVLQSVAADRRRADHGARRHRAGADPRARSRSCGAIIGSAVVLITHDMGVVAEVADRVMVMYAGRVVERGTKRDLFKSPWHPYTWGLLDSIPPLEGARPRRLKSIARQCRPRCSPCRPAAPSRRAAAIASTAAASGRSWAARTAIRPPASCRRRSGKRRARAASPDRRPCHERAAPAPRRCWKRPTSARTSAVGGRFSPGGRQIVHAVDNVSLKVWPGETSAWSANPAAASRRSAAAWCGSTTSPSGELRFQGQDIAPARAGASCGRSAARCRWCSRTPTPRSIRAAASAT